MKQRDSVLLINKSENLPRHYLESLQMNTQKYHGK